MHACMYVCMRVFVCACMYVCLIILMRAIYPSNFVVLDLVTLIKFGTIREGSYTPTITSARILKIS
jgi:hypothetical protein